ncbi:MAG: hypothetical protein R3C99_14945 [Pirellulaceae bacterium]
MYPFAEHFAKLGMVGISVRHRLLNKQQGVTVFDCVRDGRSAVRFVKAHADKFGVDPNRSSSVAVRQADMWPWEPRCSAEWMNR